MKSRFKYNPIQAALALSLALAASGASAITIDGDWSDWISPSGAGQASDWNPLSSSIKYAVEDQNDTNYLDPGYGGQAYDAEAIYVSISGGNINIAVVTGRDPLDHGSNSWRWGDIALDFGNDGVYEYGLVTLGDAGQHVSSGIGDAGEFYKVSSWNLGLWDAPNVYNPNPTSDYAKQHPTSVAAGEKLGEGSFAWSKVDIPLGNLGGDHWFMEGSIPISLIEPQHLSQAFTAQWTMGCANDWIAVDPQIPVPEPGALGLLGFGFLGLLGLRRRLR